jgi:hypothetical protein
LKNLFLLTLVFASLLSCKRDNIVPDNVSGKLTIRFENNIDGQTITPNELKYTNAAGNIYSVSTLRYYISNIQLIRESGNSLVSLNNYDLIDAFDDNFSSTDPVNIPYGRYTKMKFMLGIDRVRNHSGAQDGDLDPIHGMIWTWNTGYIFMKHEGNFVKSTGDTSVCQYHLGTDTASAMVEIPIDLTVDKESAVMKIRFNLNNMYNSPVVNFNERTIMHSLSADDIPWILKLSSNASDAFSFGGVN